MSLDLLRAALEEGGVGVVSVALCSARLLPVVFLCPLLGGQATPMPVKLAVVLSLALFLHHGAGVALSAPVTSPVGLLALTLKELSYGTVLGLVAALPFDAARMGGRFIDLFRGTSAEASLPVTGTRESASGEMLYQLLVGLAMTGGLMPWVLAGVLRSFGPVRLGAHVPSEGVSLQVVGLVGQAVSTGLSVGVPVAVVTMTVDGLLGVLSRVAPALNARDLGAPLRILAGGALLWLGVGALCERLWVDVLAVGDVLGRLTWGHGE